MVEPKTKLKPDWYDVCIIVGFSALMAGIAWLSPPIALMVGGVLAMAYGLIGSAKAGRG